jgi:hypothetical protein
VGAEYLQVSQKAFSSFAPLNKILFISGLET